MKNEWELETQIGRDMHVSPFYEAICPHGIGHHKGTHGCDGCCKDAPKEIWDKVSEDQVMTNQAIIEEFKEAIGYTRVGSAPVLPSENSDVIVGALMVALTRAREEERARCVEVLKSNIRVVADLTHGSGQTWKVSDTINEEVNKVLFSVITALESSEITS